MEFSWAFHALSRLALKERSFPIVLLSRATPSPFHDLRVCVCLAAFNPHVMSPQIKLVDWEGEELTYSSEVGGIRGGL